MIVFSEGTLKIGEDAEEEVEQEAATEVDALPKLLLELLVVLAASVLITDCSGALTIGGGGFGGGRSLIVGGRRLIGGGGCKLSYRRGRTLWKGEGEGWGGYED